MFCPQKVMYLIPAKTNFVAPQCYWEAVTHIKSVMLLLAAVCYCWGVNGRRILILGSL